MRRPERIVLALGPLGETRQAAALTQGTDAVAPTGEDLVWIGLVADVPDQPIARGVENPMQGHGQLDDAEAGAEMAPGHGHRVDGFLAQPSASWRSCFSGKRRRSSGVTTWSRRGSGERIHASFSPFASPLLAYVRRR